MTDLPNDVRALLEGPNYAHTDPGSRKARNLKRDPRVAISLTEREQPFSMAMVRGPDPVEVEWAMAQQFG